MKKTLVILLAVLCAGATLVGGEPDGPVVVLKNGTVLRGKGTNLGEKVSIALEGGGEIKLPKSQVELIASSIDEAYLQRREKLLPDNVLSQLNLANWCIDQALMTEASFHLRAAKKIDPTHPGLSRLQRKMRDRAQQAAEADEPRTQSEAPPKVDMKDLIKKRLEEARHESRSGVDEISPATRTRFSREIQPILLGSCAASKCHGATSTASAFRLVRSNPENENHTLLVKRNLQSVISRLSREAPEESKLLENAAIPHAAGMQDAPLDIGSEEFGELSRWVIAATDDLKAPAAQMASRPPTISPSKPPRLGGDDVPPLAARETGPIRNSQNSSPEKGAPKQAPNGDKKRGSSSKSSPAEETEAPNNPDEFNQRYFPKREQSSPRE